MQSFTPVAPQPELSARFVSGRAAAARKATVPAPQARFAGVEPMDLPPYGSRIRREEAKLLSGDVVVDQEAARAHRARRALGQAHEHPPQRR